MDDQRTGNIYTVYIQRSPTHGSETETSHVLHVPDGLKKTRRSSKTYCLFRIKGI
jgi:hypothetical protein